MYREAFLSYKARRPPQADCQASGAGNFKEREQTRVYLLYRHLMVTRYESE